MVATACGSSEPPPAPAPTPVEQAKPNTPGGQAGGPTEKDPCALITDGEADEALGTEADAAKREGDPVPNACNWLPANPGEGLEIVHVEIVFGGRPAYDALKSSRGGGAVRVPRIGEDAFKVDDPAGTLVTAVQGEKVVEVEAPKEADAEELAEKALARL